MVYFALVLTQPGVQCRTNSCLQDIHRQHTRLSAILIMILMVMMMVSHAHIVDIN
jgi:hypothetical protein